MKEKLTKELAVGQVAALAGVAVRTLHHYDDIGLLRPTGRSVSGYRRYGEDDVERLQQILFYRELGFSLDAIVGLLDDPSADATSHLRRQRELLTERITRLSRMAQAVDKLLEATAMNLNLTPEERLEVFGDHDPEQYAEEAQQRWGDTDAYRQSQRRTSRYTKEDWLAIQEEAGRIEAAFAAALADGVAAEDAGAMDLAEQHRGHITRWFYDCGYDIHAGLAEMYVADPRFTQHYEGVAPGLADYVASAIRANAVRAARS